MTTPHQRTPVYFVGWNYHEPLGVPLKRLLASSACPFEVKAIVHLAVLAPEVDGIPIIQNDAFLALAKTQKVKAVMMVKDELSRALWFRNSRDLGIKWLDEGELLRSGAQAARDHNAQVDLGVLSLPDAFDATSLEKLRTYSGQWPDAASNGVFRAYLQFLETGLLTPLRSAYAFRVEHPVQQTGGRSVSAIVDELQGGLAWEISAQRTSFLEQVALVVGAQAWRFAFSAEAPSDSAQGAQLLRNMLLPLGTHLASSWFELSAEYNYTEHALPNFELPNLTSSETCFLRVDAARPLQLVERFLNRSVSLHAWIRVGRQPTQLLELLQKLPIGSMTLDCDRPGPHGLQVRLSLNKH